ncbi:MAG: T9SS type A sorting domain-containing protein [bacterium]
MRKYLFAFIIIAGTNLFASAPDTLWTRTYGGTSDDGGKSVQQTTDGGFIIAGYTFVSGTGWNSDVYLIKTNSSGNSLWTKTFGGYDWDEGLSVQQTKDGGFIIAGMIGLGPSNKYPDVYLIKTNSSGDSLWTKTFGGIGADVGYSLQQTQDNGFIIAGFTESFGAGDDDVYLIKTDSTGDTLWTKTYGGTSYDEGHSVQQTSDSGFIIVGSTYSFGAGNTDVYLIKTNSSGDTLWTRTYGGTNHDYGYSVQQTQDNGFIIAGATYSFGIGTPDSLNVYLIRTDSLGDTLWTRNYGGANDDLANSVQQTKDGGYIIGGSTWSFGPNVPACANSYLIKTNSSGDTLWTKIFGGLGNDYGCSVQQTEDEGFVVTGAAWVTGDPDNASLIRLGKEFAVEEPSSNPQSPLQNPQLNVSQNPFSKSTIITYSVPPNNYYTSTLLTNVQLTIYDLAGKLVRQFPINYSLLTNNQIPWNGTDNNGRLTKTGIYFVKLTAVCHPEHSEGSNTISTTKKLILMK